ncbi:MAG: hypothetical protein LBR94_08930, partial [Desulfovibrio sp.]|nr:hypothetical protein [Desulfovibrio sp.]
MKESTQKRSGSKNRLLFGLSPWLLIGVSGILGLAIAIQAVRNSGRAEQHITQNLLDRADALIWALEAGARTSIMGGREQQPLLQPLIEETA